ncbi:MAG: hypothetical protein ACP5QS_05185 [bacterium]
MSAIASKSKDGRRIYVGIINKSMEGAIETRIEGVKVRKARAYALTGPSVDATNEENPENVKVVPLPVKIKRGMPIVNLPPHSLTFIEIE